jgi:hypothetical protein
MKGTEVHMYQLEILAKERQNDFRREVEIDRLAASVRQVTGRRNGVAASTLRWTGRQLSNWGDQLQREYANDEVASV